MGEKYLVLWKRDVNGEQTSLARKHPDRMLYDRSTIVSDRSQAISLLQERSPALVAELLPVENQSRGTYLVAAHFSNKYQHHCYDGSSDPVPTNEVMRCSKNGIEGIVRMFEAEGASPIHVGLEVKLW